MRSWSNARDAINKSSMQEDGIAVFVLSRLSNGKMETAIWHHM
jgi:hypothetical protein